MCVFNHLHIDLRCGPFGYPESLSYAIYICRMDDLYLMYRCLHTGQSNSVFMALLYLLGCAGVVSSVLCTVRIHSPSVEADKETDKASTSSIHTVPHNPFPHETNVS